MPDLPSILPLPANRVRRNYAGGAGIDIYEGAASGSDGDTPEDWLASTVEASNPGLPPVAEEGLATVAIADGSTVLLRDLIKRDQVHFLGAAHAAAFGSQTGFLAKLLDASMRLHVQAHPTAEFAQKHLNSRYGKLESYVILSIREGYPGYLRLGFQHPPTREAWRRIVEEQDIAAMDACFEPIPVQVGEVYYVPGGIPHAIGEGLTVLEVMEPSDLVVRCEFEREGIVVPPEARFMQRGLDFCLDIFDYRQFAVADVRARLQVRPLLLQESDAHRYERLIGRDQTDCFEVYRLTVSRPMTLPLDGRFHLGLVHGGGGSIWVGDERLEVGQSSRYLIAAAARALRVEPTGNEPLEIFMVQAVVPDLDLRLYA